jgi:hypothetical protein
LTGLLVSWYFRVNWSKPFQSFFLKLIRLLFCENWRLKIKLLRRRLLLASILIVLLLGSVGIVLISLFEGAIGVTRIVLVTIAADQLVQVTINLIVTSLAQNIFTLIAGLLSTLTRLCLLKRSLVCVLILVIKFLIASITSHVVILLEVSPFTFLIVLIVISIFELTK